MTIISAADEILAHSNIGRRFGESHAVAQYVSKMHKLIFKKATTDAQSDSRPPKDSMELTLRTLRNAAG